MKKFFSLVLVAIAVVISLSMTVLFSASAEVDNASQKENVIFISDNATAGGDGSSAESPLYPSEVPAYEISEVIDSDDDSATETYGKYYLRTALYQASEKLIDTGGTIVICGPVVIDNSNSYGSSTSNKDFYLAESDKEIIITSTYNGVDYAKTNGACLSIGGAAHLSLSGPTTFEYITIKNTAQNRLICARGNKLVMGDGITCSLPTGQTSGYYYPSIAGGKRYASLVGDTNVTIKSGTYAYISGSNWGTPRKEIDKETGEEVAAIDLHTGNVYLNLLGGTYRANVSGMSANAYNVVVDGDIYMNIGTNCYFGMAAYATSSGRFAREGCKVYVRLDGRPAFYKDRGVSKQLSFASSLSSGVYDAESYILDLASANPRSRTTGTAGEYITNYLITQSGMSIIYPANWATSVTATVDPVKPNAVFKGDVIGSEGAVLNVSFLNKYDNTTTYSSTVSFDESNYAFKTECDTSTAGKKTVDYYYGNTKYYSTEIDVLELPTIGIQGARIKTNDDVQTLRFVASHSGPIADGAVITEKGVIVIKGHMLSSPDKLNFDETYGMFKCLPAADGTVSVGNTERFECNFDLINRDEFNTDYYARAYLKFNYGGKEYVRYSDVISRNPYDIAKRAIEGGLETQETKDNLQAKVVDAYDNFDQTKQYASDDTVNELRQRVVAYMRKQATIEWTPSETFALYNNLTDTVIESEGGIAFMGIFEAGKTYYGMPYVSSINHFVNTSNFESFTHLVGENNVVDVESLGVTKHVLPSKCDSWKCSFSHDDISDCIAAYDNKMKGYIDGTFTDDQKIAAYQNYTVFPGSHCSQAVFMAWNTVINNKGTVDRLAYTSNMVPGHNSGIIPVGDYVYTGTERRSDTKVIAQELNTKEVMYASYDKLRPGDAMIQYLYNADGEGAGHTRLIISVDPTAKTVTTLECANWAVPYVNVKSTDGTAVLDSAANSCWKELTYNYDYLIETGYLPVTIKELTTGLVEKDSVIYTDAELNKDLSQGTLGGVVKSNKQIVSVKPVIKAADGNVVYDEISYLFESGQKHLSSYDLKKLDVELALTSGAEYTFSLEVGIGNEQTHILVTDYRFTAK